MVPLKERLQQILLRDKIISQADLDKALEEQKKVGGELSKILVKMNLIGEKELTLILSEGLGIPPIDITRLNQGVYFYRLEIDGVLETKRITMICSSNRPRGLFIL